MEFWETAASIFVGFLLVSLAVAGYIEQRLKTTRESAHEYVKEHVKNIVDWIKEIEGKMAKCASTDELDVIREDLRSARNLLSHLLLKKWNGNGSYKPTDT